MLLFALEVVVNKRDNGDILLNPGNYKHPKPFSKSNHYQYFGYIIAGDKEEADKVFAKDADRDRKESEGGKEFQSFDAHDRAVIAADFHRFGGEDDEIQLDVENMDGDIFNMMQNSKKQVQKDEIIFATLEDNMLAINHIIICGMVENIQHFIMPLRSELCDEPTPIVILHDEPPSSR